MAQKLEVELLGERFGEAILKVKEHLGDTFLCVERTKLPDVIQFLKEHPALRYDYFVECLGVDYSRWNHARDLPERFEVVYNLMSVPRAARIFLKVGVDDGQSVPTVKHLFLGAEYPEREVNDMFGIHFEGNEQQGRFLLPDDWVGYPLRKEYPLGGEDVVFDQETKGPAVEDMSKPHAGESFEGKTGTTDVSGR